MGGVRGVVLSAVLWAGGARGAFIDNRPVMPRSTYHQPATEKNQNCPCVSPFLNIL